MTQSITLKAPAKVNLFLDVLGKRSDGYHDIVTVFERIDICDKITISKKAHKGITVSCNGGIPERENLAYKAACLIFSKGRLKEGLNVEIKKKIPVASGLGGGSSDAASTLIGINKLFKLDYRKDVLMELAKSIGADVPFFVSERSFAIGKERGDRIGTLSFKPPNMWHLIVFPGIKKLTKDIYRALGLVLTKRGSDVKILLHALKRGDLHLIKEAAYNRLEDPALDRHPGLSALKSNLVRLGMEGALLAGSGPTIFAIMRTRKEAVSLKEKILEAIGMKAEGWQMFVAPTL